MMTNYQTPQGSLALIFEEEASERLSQLLKTLMFRMEIQNIKICLLSAGERMSEARQAVIRKMLYREGAKGVSMINLMHRIDAENPVFLNRAAVADIILVYGAPGDVCRLLPDTSLFQTIEHRHRSDCAFMIAAIGEAATALGEYRDMDYRPGLQLLKGMIHMKEDQLIVVQESGKEMTELSISFGQALYSAGNHDYLQVVSVEPRKMTG